MTVSFSHATWHMVAVSLVAAESHCSFQDSDRNEAFLISNNCDTVLNQGRTFGGNYKHLLQKLPRPYSVRGNQRSTYGQGFYTNISGSRSLRLPGGCQTTYSRQKGNSCPSTRMWTSHIRVSPLIELEPKSMFSEEAPDHPVLWVPCQFGLA